MYIGSYNVNGVSGFTKGSGNIGGFLFFLPTDITTNDISFGIAHADSSDQYDIGIHGPYTGVETTLPLVCHDPVALFADHGPVLTNRKEDER